MIPNELKMSLEKALKQSSDFKQAYETEEVTRELVDTAFVLEDITRNSSVPVSSCAANSTGAPAGLCWTALIRRLHKACSIKPKSNFTNGKFSGTRI